MPYYNNLYTPIIDDMPRPGGSLFHPSRARRKIGRWAEASRNEVYRVQRNVDEQLNRITTVYTPRLAKQYQNAREEYHRAEEANARNYSYEFANIEEIQKEAMLQNTLIQFANNRGLDKDLVYLSKAKIDKKTGSAIDKLEWNYDTNQMRLRHQMELITDKYNEDLYELQLKYKSGLLYKQQLDQMVWKINASAQDAKDAISSAHNMMVGTLIGGIALGALTGGLGGGLFGAMKGAISSLASLTVPQLLNKSFGGVLGKFVSGMTKSAFGLQNPFEQFMTSVGRGIDYDFKTQLISTGGTKLVDEVTKDNKIPGIIYDEKSLAQASDELIHNLGGRVLNLSQLSNTSYDILKNPATKSQNGTLDLFANSLKG